VGWPKGLHGREGDRIPCVVEVEGNEIWWIEIVVRIGNPSFGLLSVDSGQPRGSYLLVD
jgi:hypothetical protein